MKKIIYGIIILTILGLCAWFFSIKAKANDEIMLGGGISAATTYTNAAINNGIVGIWNMDTNDIYGTTVWDKSFRSNNATTIGSPTFVAGKKKQAIDLNGTSQRLTVPDNDSFDFGTGNFTLALWINMDDPGAGQHDTIYCKGNPETASQWCFQVLGAGITSQVLNFRSGATSIASSASQITTSTWTHVAVRRSGTSIQMYINGVANGSAGVSAVNLTNTQDISIGYRNAGYNGYFAGLMDDVRIYDIALTNNEIKNLYNSIKIININTNTTWYIQ